MGNSVTISSRCPEWLSLLEGMADANLYCTPLASLGELAMSSALCPSASLHMFLMYQLQHLERFIDMPLRGELREKDATDNSLSVDDVCHAPRQPESRGHAVALSDDAVQVA